MKTPLLLLVVMFGGALVPPNALAGTVSYGGGVFSFQAAPGEGNHIIVEQTTDCETLAAPCLRYSDVAFNPVTVPSACVDTGFMGILCPLPTSVVLDLGDRVDIVDDWDGPSVIHGGLGGDVIRGRGGNDALYGDDGMDAVLGGPGNDRVDGGPGSDILETYLAEVDGPADPLDSAGTDVLVGGGGADIASYEFRLDPLTISKNGKADDGAPGERDNVSDDVEEVRGGVGDDAIVGGPGADQLRGMAGDDIVTGAEGQDYVDGGDDDDTVLGGDGNDDVAGGGNSDLVVGGAGSDFLMGEYRDGCAASIIGCSDGDDELRADDGLPDAIDCGGGEDRAAVDRIDRLATLASCERVSATGHTAQSCAQVPRSLRATCRIVLRALRSCAAAVGARHKRCLKRAVRRASKTCRRRFHGRRRMSCLRSVRGIVRQ